MDNRYIVPGIPDESFERISGIPISKSEIRALVLSRLQIHPGLVLYDIGSGTGSIAIESKLLQAESRVFAIEKNIEAIELIKRNSLKLGVEIDIVCGEAPEVLDDLPRADRIFIGGSGGKLNEILDACNTKLNKGGRIIITSVTVHTASLAIQILDKNNYQWEAIQINIAETSSKKRAKIWEARNPISIITAMKEVNN